MRWSTLSLEKVSLQYIEPKVNHLFFRILPVVNVLYVTTGEPHIDGEPGDLRFRIKVLKYEEALYTCATKY